MAKPSAGKMPTYRAAGEAWGEELRLAYAESAEGWGLGWRVKDVT